MNIKRALPSLLAAALLLIVGRQTSQALRQVAPPKQKSTTGPPADPYARLDHLIATANQALPPGTMRDPFSFGDTRAAPAVSVPRTGRSRPAKATPVAASRPILTAIIADEDPRALIRFEQKHYTVKTGDLFAEFRVVSISADQVVLADGRNSQFVLKRPTKGE